MSTELKERIQSDMRAALRAREKDRLSAIRLILAAIQRVEVDQRVEMSDERVLAVLDKMVKERRDSAQQYEAAGRQDLADKETFEIGVIQTYLPPQLGDEEIDAMIASAIAETGATGPQDVGKVIAKLKPQLQGRAEMRVVSARIKEQLSA